MQNIRTNAQDLDKFTGRKVQMGSNLYSESLPDSLAAWIECYLGLAVIGVYAQL